MYLESLNEDALLGDIEGEMGFYQHNNQLLHPTAHFVFHIRFKLPHIFAQIV